MRTSLSSAILVAACAGMLALTGCSGSDSNDGADTTCKDFLAADASTQDEMVTDMLKDRNGKEPANGEVTLTKISVQGFCNTIGKDSSKISDIDGSVK